MKKKASARSAKATSRQSTLNFPTSSEADLVAESAAAVTSTDSAAKKRSKRTADFADKHNESNGDSSVPLSSAPTERNKKAQGKKRSAAALGQHPSTTESPEGATVPSSSAKNRRKRTADFADDADKHNKSQCDSSAISAQSAVKANTVASIDTWSTSVETNEESHWPVIPLGELAADERNSITDGPFGSKLKTEHYTHSGPRVIRLKNIGDTEFVDAKAHISEEHFATLQKHRVFPGDVVIAALGEDPPRSCIVPVHLGPAIVKADCIRFKAGPRILAKFINYVLNAPDVRRHAKAIVHGVGRPRLNLGEIKSLPIPVPPIPEQHRIVAEIEKQFTRLDAGVAALKRVQANLKRYRAAVLKAACEGKLVPTEAELSRTADYADIADKDMRLSASSAKSAVKMPPFETGEQLLQRILTQRRQNWQGRGQYKEPAGPETTDIIPLPDGWVWTALAQLSTHITDGTHKTPTYVESGIPFLSAKDISGFRLSFEKCRRIPPSEHEELSKRCAVRRGNVLITKSGTIGRVAVVETDDEFSLFESVANVPVIPPIEPQFISIAAFVGIAGAFGAANQKGVAVRHLHLEDLRRVPIPLPPLAEQTRIVAEVERRLSVVDELEAVVSANLQRSARLRQSILQKAFTGELV